MNVGEELVAAYLEHIKGCEFTQKNLYTPDVQGEIDVIGIDLETKSVYICEVAIHLITGLQYVKNGQPDNVKRLVTKFGKDIEYANKYFKDYDKHFMLWSPIVKDQRSGAKHNQLRDVHDIQRELLGQYGIELELIINERFLSCLNELRNKASEVTKELKSPVMRLLQIEERLQMHVEKLEKAK